MEKSVYSGELMFFWSKKMKKMFRIKVDNIGDFFVDGVWILEGIKEAFGVLGIDEKEV